MSCGNAKVITHLEKIKPLLQCDLAFLEQCAHLALTQKLLDLAAFLLSLEKGMNLVEGPNNSGQYCLISWTKYRQDTLKITQYVSTHLVTKLRLYLT
jgi:hypothetical protein